jgi:acyl carrier protein
MQRDEIVTQLKNFIASEILYGNASNLDDETPLLEWGILNSLEMTRIFSFIAEKFDLQLPINKVNAENFKDVNSIANLVLESTEVKLTEIA